MESNQIVKWTDIGVMLSQIIALGLWVTYLTLSLKFELIVELTSQDYTRNEKRWLYKRLAPSLCQTVLCLLTLFLSCLTFFIPSEAQPWRVLVPSTSFKSPRANLDQNGKGSIYFLRLAKWYGIHLL